MTGATGAERPDLAVRIKAAQGNLAAQHRADRFHLLVDALAHHQLAANAADQDREALATAGLHLPGALGRHLGAVEQFVGARMHQFQGTVQLDRPGQRQAAAALVNAQNGSNQPDRLAIRAQNRERKEQPGGRQVLGVLAEIALVDVQRGLAVKFIKNVAVAARDRALGAKGLPSAKAPVREDQRVAVQAQSDHLLVGDTLRAPGPGLPEGAAVAGQAAGQRDALAHHRGDPLDQGAAVDLRSGSEDQHGAQIGAAELAADALPRRS